ncbi:PilZ domain-containing protein [Alishewanella sp. SMS8]|uniref:PilZ domain-containing protein n=1 Tax=unclassified Alishewanella TaxID=2628974 RepID=UPI002741E6AA|nr:PilZ domain-containing protein [Alishewanella sp. SMS8]MDP5035939.1 PilZ domain-containing protein [Alishewanella sp.]MDP5206505.1 PilZ domain-containing protein [Alishewanella sp. SMS9]MDP5460736.1 PilZ domain-containing protein [Alishewanella sp. SMS8]
MVNRNDNRHFYRMMVNADVKLMINDPEAARVIDGVCRDLSASGMSVETDELIELGTLIRIRLESPNASVPPLDATAKVMRCSQDSEESYNLGLAFIELN